MSKLRVVIHVGSEQIGFLASIARVLAERHHVHLLVKNKDVMSIMSRLVPEISGNIAVISDYKRKLKDGVVLSEATKLEELHGQRFSMLMSYDRAFGQGYLFNADKHPNVIRSAWSHLKKLRLILEEFDAFDRIISDTDPGLIIGLTCPLILEVISDTRKIPHFTLNLSRIGDRYCWYENRHEEKKALVRRVSFYLSGGAESGRREEAEYELYALAKKDLMAASYSYSKSFFKASRIIAKQCYKMITGRYRRESYVFCGWVGPVLRAPQTYRYLSRRGCTPDRVRGYKIVYFPLHMEPESSLLSLSPEFNNSMEIVAWVSKSLPADSILVIKENPWSFGVRSKNYYRMLMKIPNVLFAHPSIPSQHWIKAAAVVVTITGTAGFEAVYENRPVLSYGKHQIINYLPTVKYSQSFFSTRRNLQKLLALNGNQCDLERSKRALHLALMDVSFSLPGFENLYKSHELRPELACVAVSRLFSDYPELYSVS